DHMGRPDIDQGINSQGFQQFQDLMARNGNIWTKVSCPERLSTMGPPYDDVIAFSRALVAAFPTRVLWGTDWPHPNMKSHMPDDGHLVDIIPKIAPTKALQEQLLVTNPLRLYWDE
ncbi:MAG TPA: 2-pyrone-4,6-dicarboxylate hydrolase, partial [Hellea balneolensis]|nr:2-pyrone-4,6-dicarboxylate hydrolase [Hellea balneolensis]